MPVILLGSEQHALRSGTNTLGGWGGDAIELAPLAKLPPSVEIVVRPNAPTLIQRVAPDASVMVDGEKLGPAPLILRHGARIRVESCTVVYDGLTPAERLVHAASGHVVPLDKDEMVIGRAESSHIPLDGRGVSRRHAVIRRTAQGCTLTDESANGTFVNGARVTGQRLLAAGDVLRFGTEELVFEGPATTAPTAPAHATQLLAAVPEPGESPDGAAPTRPAVRSPVPGQPLRPLASLEVLGGAHSGTVIQVQRPVCALGRGDQNDVRITDGSISLSHATLLLKRGTWYVVDLGSANGTFVDGYRVAGERVLPTGCTLRLGTVNIRFRPTADSLGAAHGTQRVVSIFGRISKLLAAGG